MGDFICVCGIIGSGKSTLTKNLSEILGYDALYESVKDNPYLERFYDDPKKYTFTMQIWCLNKRYEHHKYATQSEKYSIQDSSFLNDIVFAKMLHRDGIFNDDDYNTYLVNFDNLKNSLIINPRIIVYLDVEPKVALERVKLRNRDCEKSLPLEYLINLKKEYEEWLESNLLKNTRVIKINWNVFNPVEDLLNLLDDHP